jgi:hypothetical protein
MHRQERNSNEISVSLWRLWGVAGMYREHARHPALVQSVACCRQNSHDVDRYIGL